MSSFKRAYTVSAVFLSVVATLSVLGGIGSGNDDFGMELISLLVAALALFPIYWRGGILANPRLSISISSIFAIGTGSVVASEFRIFVETAGGGTVDPSGSPLAEMIALAFMAAIGFCPWLITTLRGLPHWNPHKQD